MSLLSIYSIKPTPSVYSRIKISKISSHHFDSSSAICSENRWVCVFNWLLSTDIPSQRNSSTTIQLLFLRWNKGLYSLSVREAETLQANTPHGWYTVNVYTSIYKIAANLKTGWQGRAVVAWCTFQIICKKTLDERENINVKITKPSSISIHIEAKRCSCCPFQPVL